jgi:isocitrate dehydrogenase
MLVHIGQPDAASLVHNGWLKTLEDGIHTYDIFKEGLSKKKVGTKEFADAVIQNLGKNPKQLKTVSYQAESPQALAHKHAETAVKRHLVGIDVFIYHKGTIDQFLPKISHINIGSLRLKMISNRGVQVWPGGQKETFCIEQWRCRFLIEGDHSTSQNDLIQILHAFDHVQMDVIKSEFLYTFDGKPGFSAL